MLSICHWVDVSHDQDLESFLIVICYDSKYEMMIRIEMPLIEEWGSIKDNQVGASLDVGDYLWL